MWYKFGMVRQKWVNPSSWLYSQEVWEYGKKERCIGDAFFPIYLTLDRAVKGCRGERMMVWHHRTQCFHCFHSCPQLAKAVQSSRIASET